MNSICKSNEIRNEIKTAETLILRNEETIKRLGGAPNPTDYTKAQIAKLTETVASLKNKIEILKNTPEDFVPNVREKKENTKRNRGVVKQPYVQHVKQEYKPREYNGCSEKYMQKETDRYFSIVNSVPSFITDKLKNMPCNKGYGWRGVFFNGSRPPDSETMTTYFEKCKGGILRIYETTKHEQRVYEKVGKERKKLTSVTQRTFKP
jgi:hypothetical protein